MEIVEQTENSFLDSEGTQLSETVYYGGRGVGGEYYLKDFGDDESETVWTILENEQKWMPEDFEIIARHLRETRKSEST